MRTSAGWVLVKEDFKKIGSWGVEASSIWQDFFHAGGARALDENHITRLQPGFQDRAEFARVGCGLYGTFCSRQPTGSVILCMGTTGMEFSHSAVCSEASDLSVQLGSLGPQLSH